MSNTLRDMLSEGRVSVDFIKADGSYRTMLATTKLELIDYQFKNGVEDRHAGPANVIKVWDLDNNAWRAIREDRVKSWTAV